MDDKTQALVSAAFHAWITLGDLREGHAVSREELTAVYVALTAALQAFPPPPDAPTRRSR